MYGHMDKQPFGEGWTTDPCDPVIKDGKMWGRGSVDDGYALFSAVLAIKADDERMQNFAASCKWEVEFQGIVGFAVPPHSNATLSVRLMEGTPCSEVCPGMRGRLHSQSACTTSTPRRFKILAVASC
jgi:hypothetical protein